MCQGYKGTEPRPPKPHAGLSIDEMLSVHERLYRSETGQIMRAPTAGVHIVEVRSEVQEFVAPPCDFHRFNFQLSGRMALIDFGLTRQTKRKPRHLTAGSFAYIPSGTEAVARIDGDSLHVLQVMIPRASMRRALERVTGSPKNDDDMTGHIGSAGLSFLRIGQLFHQEYTAPTKGTPEMMGHLSEMLCIELARSFNTPASERPSLAEDEIQRVVDMLPAVVEGTAKLSDVADALGLAPYQFTRRFQAHFGETPRQYVLHLRLEQVREMLAATSLRLPEIAYSCGFSSQAHMTSAFSKHFGISPARYRSRQSRPKQK